MGCIRWTREEIGHTTTSARLLAAVALVGMLVVIAAIVPSQAGAASPGSVSFELHARTPEEGLVSTTNVTEQAWMRDHYKRMRGYSPFFDRALGWAPPSSFYRDLYALYRGQARDETLMSQHPDWVLRDASGNRLYIPFECSGGTCGQYAADVGNPQWRAHWIDEARKTFALGYSGIFVDDVNLEMKVSNGNGNLVAPIDPRTGQPMTEADWARYVAEFTEEIRAAFPDAEITHNSLWWMNHNDPSVQREVAAADVIEMERGFNDGGMSGGSGQWSYRAYLAHVDWLHSRGVGVVYEPYNLNAQSAVFELANYLLAGNGNDLITSQYRSKPNDWWSGWDTDLGAANGDRYSWNGLLRRDFAGGMVLTNEPQAPSRTVQLPAGAQWTDLDGNLVTSVTLGPRSGAVLRSSSPPESEQPPTQDPAPTPDPAVDTSPTAGGSGSGDGTATTPPPGPETAPTISVKKPKVKRGHKMVLSGKASASSVEVRAYINGTWKVVAEDDSVTAGDYRVKVKATSPGIVRLKAAAPGLGESGTVRVKIKG